MNTVTSLSQSRILGAALAGIAIGILGGLIGLGGAEFRLPVLIALFGFAALQPVSQFLVQAFQIGQDFLLALEA